MSNPTDREVALGKTMGDLYRMLDKLTRVALEKGEYDLFKKAGVDLNEACGVLSSVDEDKHYVDLAAKLDMLAARWMFFKIDGGDERRAAVIDAIENLVGFRIEVMPSDSADWPRHRLEQRLKDHERQASEIRKTLSTLPRNGPKGRATR